MGLFGIFKKKEPIHFEEIDSIEKAKAECKKKNLVRSYIVSPKIGGTKDDSNVVFVPFNINGIKGCYDCVAQCYLEDGTAKTYECIPEYKGNSVVPCKLTIVCGKDGEEVYRQEINVW